MAEPAGVEKAIAVRVLALCGQSMLIDGIEASLRGCAGVETVLLDTSRPTAVQVLDNLSPDIIIFDLAPSQLGIVLPFQRSHPDVVLIGLDIASDVAWILSGDWRVLPSVADLMQMIEARIQVKNGRRL